MVDLGRCAALAWALFAAVYARSWRDAGLLVLAAYVFALEIASGFAIRSEGPQMPMVALLLVFVGPTGMPRGHLPTLPLAGLVVHWPSIVHTSTAVVFALGSRHATVRASRLPEYSTDLLRMTRVALAFTLCLTFESALAVIRVLAWSLGAEF
jgi:hypothetical protein